MRKSIKRASINFMDGDFDPADLKIENEKL